MLSLASRIALGGTVRSSVNIVKGSSLQFSTFLNPRSRILRGNDTLLGKIKVLCRRPTSTETMVAMQRETLGTQRAVGYWLLGCSGMVFGAVVLGGVTRLTESGLSMVTWKLLGERMPTTEEGWKAEFEQYKQFPEYKTKNMSMTLEEFKRIWWMEYAHRMWGRCIGAAFFLPAAFFWTKGYFSRGMKIRTVVIGSLIAAQGLLGWYMVQSGLEDRFDGPSDVARVSQHRLASHLGLAFVLYTGLLWSALDRILPAETLPIVTSGATRVRALAHASKAFVFLTAISGAFVAGLDAGLVYNSFPKMGDNWIPDEILSMNPKRLNFTENPVTVQFDHRILGTTTLAVITWLWLAARKQCLPPRARLAVHALAAAAWTQVTLGITTLLHYVPVTLAAMHQSGSLIVLSSAIWLTHEMKHVKRFIK